MRGRRFLEEKVASWPEDAEAHYGLAVLLLDEYLRTSDQESLGRARALLEQSVKVAPTRTSHAALGYALDAMGDGAQALSSFREAQQLDPGDEVVEAYVLTLLAETGAEAEAMASIEEAARRRGVDLEAVKRELRAARLPEDTKTLVNNGFVHARNFLASRLSIEAERILNQFEPGRADRVNIEATKDCVRRQRELGERFNESVLPEAVRGLASWAAKHGIADDSCRVMMLAALSRTDRDHLIFTVDRLAPEAHRWLDTFGDRPMPLEAAALLYLLKGVEELR